jgi:hypothetical protein
MMALIVLGIAIFLVLLAFVVTEVIWGVFDGKR